MRTHEADWFPIIFTGLQAQRKWALGKSGWQKNKDNARIMVVRADFLFPSDCISNPPGRLTSNEYSVPVPRDWRR
jgi:hypothetical protein